MPVNNQRRDYGETLQKKAAEKPIEKQTLPPIYGNLKSKQKQP
jgi:hypothetical protein